MNPAFYLKAVISIVALYEEEQGPIIDNCLRYMLHRVSSATVAISCSGTIIQARI